MYLSNLAVFEGFVRSLSKQTRVSSEMVLVSDFIGEWRLLSEVLVAMMSCVAQSAHDDELEFYINSDLKLRVKSFKPGKMSFTVFLPGFTGALSVERCGHWVELSYARRLAEAVSA